MFLQILRKVKALGEICFPQLGISARYLEGWIMGHSLSRVQTLLSNLIWRRPTRIYIFFLISKSSKERRCRPILKLKWRAGVLVTALVWSRKRVPLNITAHYRLGSVKKKNHRAAFANNFWDDVTIRTKLAEWVMGGVLSAVLECYQIG